MRLHENKQLFADAINAASRPKNDGGLGIKSIFIEKDYWICRSLKLMAEGDKDGKAVFKGEHQSFEGIRHRGTLLRRYRCCHCRSMDIER